MGTEDEVTKLKAVVATLEEKVRALSEQMASLEAADPRPDPFDEAEAAATVDRLLGISKVDMSQDVQDLLWTSALRRLGVLSFTEYQRRIKVLLAREVASSPSASQTDRPRTDPDVDRSKPETPGSRKGGES